MKKFSHHPYVLGIDLGTHGPKVGLISVNGEIINWEFEPTPYRLTPNGGAEQDPEDWWEAILKATHRLLEKNIVPVEDIIAIGPSAQWCGVVAVDGGGQPLMNAIIWMDSRGACHNQKLYQRFPSYRGYGIIPMLTFMHYTGGGPGLNGKDALGHILYIKNEHPKIYQQTYKFLEVKDYINLRLTGKAAASVDSAFDFFVTDNRNPLKVKYAPRLLRMTGLAREKMPDLRLATDILGPLSPQTAHDLGLPERTQVVMGSPDLNATAIGSGAVEDFSPHLYLGTSSYLNCHVPFQKCDPANFIGSMPSSIPGRYITVDEQDWAAGCLDVYLEKIVYPMDSFADHSTPEDMFERLNNAAARIPPGSGKVIFTPWLYGERTPIDDAYVRGSFFNLSPETTREHLARAIMEGVAYNGRWLLNVVEKFCKRRLDNIHALGGGSASDVWLQIHADVFNRTIRQVKDPRLAPMRGAALIALVAIGSITFNEIPNLVQISNTFKPITANQKVYDELFNEFINFYKQNKNAYKRLNRNDDK